MIETCSSNCKYVFYAQNGRFIWKSSISKYSVLRILNQLFAYTYIGLFLCSEIVVDFFCLLYEKNKITVGDLGSYSRCCQSPCQSP